MNWEGKETGGISKGRQTVRMLKIGGETLQNRREMMEVQATV
jgi:hypothetical protein